MAACPHFCAPEAPCPRWAHHNSLPEEAADTRAPKSSCRITVFASAAIARFWTSSTGSRFRKKIHHTLDELQTDLDAWLVEYNYRRSHQGRLCFGKTPMQTFLDAIPLAKEKLMAA